MATELWSESPALGATAPDLAESAPAQGRTARRLTSGMPIPRVRWQHIRRFLIEDARFYFTGGNKPLLRQIREMIRLMLAYRYLPYHYIRHQLFRAWSEEDVLDFIPPKLVERLRNNANAAGQLRLTVDKSAFHQWCQDNDLPTPATLPFGALGRLCDDSAHGQSGKYFVKPRFGGSGVRVGRLITLDDEFLLFSAMHRTTDAADVVARVCADEDFIIQSYVRQHPAINAVFAGSLNTIRVETIDTGSEIIINCALLRVGTAASGSDNWSNGSLIINIDPETGRTDGPGRRQLNFDGRIFDEHPNSGAPLSGVQIPYWSQVRETCQRAAERMRPFKMLGWDVAISEDGVVLIEVNEDYGIDMCQEACRGLRKTYWGKFF